MSARNSTGFGVVERAAAETAALRRLQTDLGNMPRGEAKRRRLHPRHPSTIQRTFNTQSRLLHDMRVNLGGADILVSEQFLHGTNVITRLQLVRGKAMTQRVARRRNETNAELPTPNFQPRTSARSLLSRLLFPGRAYARDEYANQFVCFAQQPGQQRLGFQQGHPAGSAATNARIHATPSSKCLTCGQNHWPTRRLAPRRDWARRKSHTVVVGRRHDCPHGCQAVFQPNE